MLAWQNDDAHFQPGFDLFDGMALFIQQESRTLDRQMGDHFFRAFLHGFFFENAQHRKRYRFHVAYRALAFTARARQLRGIAQRRTHPLSGHFQQAETRDTTGLNAGSIDFKRITQMVFHRALIFIGQHVNEVDDKQAAQIAQSELAGDFIGRFQVGIQRSFFNVAAFGGAGGVDVN